MNNKSSSGLGLSSILTVVFVVLKLVGVIAWSWWWVFSPILIDTGLVIIAMIVLIIWDRHENKKLGLTSKISKNNKWLK